MGMLRRQIGASTRSTEAPKGAALLTVGKKVIIADG